MRILIERGALLASLLLVAGCSTPVIGTDSAKVAREIGHIQPSQHDTCETQRQIAVQSSKIDTIIKGKEAVYKAKPCPTEPKTS